MNLVRWFREKGQAVFTVTVIIFLLGIFLSFGAVSIYQKRESPELGSKYVAKIGKEKLGWDDFGRGYADRLSLYREYFGQDMSPETEEVARKDVLEQFVTEQALIDYAEKNKIKVTKQEVEEKITEMRGQFKSSEGSTSRTTGNVFSDLFGKWATEDPAKVAWDSYLERERLTESELRQRLQKELLIEKVRQRVNLESNADGEKKVEDEIKKVREEVLSKKISFEDAAKKYSEDDGTKESGGMTPQQWVLRGFYEPEIDELAFKKLKIGEVSDIVKIEDLQVNLVKFYIMKLEGLKRAEGKDYETKRPELAKRFRETYKKPVGYQPTEDELKSLYEIAKFRVILKRYRIDPSKGDKRIQEISKSYPRQVEDEYIQAIEAYANKSYDKAIELYKRIAVRMPDDGNVYYMIAKSYSDWWKDWEKEKKEKEKLKKDSNKASSTKGEKKERAKAKGDTEPSAKPVTKGEMKPKEAAKPEGAAKQTVPELKMTKAQVQKEIESNLKTAIDKQENPFYYLELAILYVEQKKKADAVKNLESAYEIGAKAISVLTSIKNAYLELEETQKTNKIQIEIEAVQKELIQKQIKLFQQQQQQGQPPR